MYIYVEGFETILKTWKSFIRHTVIVTSFVHQLLRFHVTWSLLQRLPQTRLGKLREGRHTEAIYSICDNFNLEVNYARVVIPRSSTASVITLT